MQTYDAVVIGSGISGLTSALLLSKKFKKVAIVEQALDIAPLFSGFNRRGVHFETGFHYSGALGDDEVGGYMFKELGLDVPVELCNKDGFDSAHLVDSNRIFKMPFGRRNMEEKLIEYFPCEKEGIKKYLDLCEAVISATPFLNIHRRSFKDEDFFRFSGSTVSLREVLNKCFKDEEIKTLLSFSSILYGSPPSMASFDFHCCCSAIMYSNVWKIKGGASTLVRAFKEALKKQKIDVLINTKVVRIENSDNVKKISFADGSQIASDICVSAIHPKEFIKIAPIGSYRKKNFERIKEMRDTCGFFVLYGILAEDCVDNNINNIAFLKANDFENDHKNFMYINISDTRPRAACVVQSVDSDEKFWNISKEDYKAKKIKIAQEIKAKISLLCPDIFSKIQFVDMSSPATMKKYVNYYGTYGSMHCINNANVMPITKIPGLFLVGQATVAPGLIGSMISAFFLDKLMKREQYK
ncbi:phytoene desaturase family protein [Endomicrobium proavitum]|uniref:Putative All-trans-retinol 13,14-reductase n=1 Tax=Endomicrobium proavitum TaxID=1408281 RepID=A0A0G3WLE3_9BACT|nr:FAD-dependent oxidoreductase [Endomicrobium proavitum]AKL98329.1 putative All-trans-retinol 13,14-reductase [Endomicrobium proavitum]